MDRLIIYQPATKNYHRSLWEQKTSETLQDLTGAWWPMGIMGIISEAVQSDLLFNPWHKSTVLSQLSCLSVTQVLTAKQCGQGWVRFWHNVEPERLFLMEQWKMLQNGGRLSCPPSPPKSSCRSDRLCHHAKEVFNTPAGDSWSDLALVWSQSKPWPNDTVSPLLTCALALSWPRLFLFGGQAWN